MSLSPEDKTKLKKTRLQLTGLDGNVFAILGRVKVAMRQAGFDATDMTEVLNDLRSSGSYAEVLEKLTVMFKVS